MPEPVIYIPGSEIPADVTVSEDDALQPMEKEVSITWGKTEGRATVFSEIRGITKRLLQHPHFEPSEGRMQGDDLVALRGQIPTGCLKVGVEPRTSGGHAELVSSGVLSDD